MHQTKTSILIQLAARALLLKIQRRVLEEKQSILSDQHQLSLRVSLSLSLARSAAGRFRSSLELLLL